MIIRWHFFICYSSYLLFIYGCAGPSLEIIQDIKREEPTHRPGLATSWGETRHSSARRVSFIRAYPNTPAATATLYYNDEAGLMAMAGLSYIPRTFRKTWPVTPDYSITIGLQGENRQFLEGFANQGRTYIIGQMDDRYMIVVNNKTDNRLEAVLSVDGLDVLDGKPADFSQSGYVIDPHTTLVVEGFRQSMDTIAAFRFGSVPTSYAYQKHGEAKNVGVIGLAIFHEWGTDPFGSPPTHEINRRQAADPFPGRFATPPN